MKPLRRLSKLARRFPLRWTGRGRYRFLVRDWAAISDIDLAARVLDVESFSDQLEPVRLPVGDLERVLVIAPHQDDETIGAGGLLLQARDNGAAVTVLFVTDGVQRGLARQLGGDAELARIRDAEARQVCEVLGADLVNLGISNPDPAPTLAIGVAPLAMDTLLLVGPAGYVATEVQAIGEKFHDGRSFPVRVRLIR